MRNKKDGAVSFFLSCSEVARVREEEDYAVRSNGQLHSLRIPAGSKESTRTEAVARKGLKLERILRCGV